MREGEKKAAPTQKKGEKEREKKEEEEKEVEEKILALAASGQAKSSLCASN